MKFDFSFYSEVLRSLSNSQSAVFFVIYHYYCMNGRYSFPTTVIANNCKLSNSQVKRVLKDLERIGILKIVRKGFKQTNEYIPVCNRNYLEVERNSNRFEEQNEPIQQNEPIEENEPIVQNEPIKSNLKEENEPIESANSSNFTNRIQFNGSKTNYQKVQNLHLKSSKRSTIGDIIGDNIGDINKTKVTSTTVTTSGNNTKVTNTKVTPIEDHIESVVSSDTPQGRSASKDASKDVYIRYHEVCRSIDDYIDTFEERNGKSVANATSNVEGYSGLFETVSHYDGRGLVGSDFERMKLRLKEAYNLMSGHFIVTCQMIPEEKGKLKALYDEHVALFEESDRNFLKEELNS